MGLDGTDNKNKLGANAILGVSMAVCKVSILNLGYWKSESDIESDGKLFLALRIEN